MRIWTVIWFLAATVAGVFVAVNWQALAAPAIINLILWQVNAPLGLVMLGALVASTVLHLVFLVWLESKALVQFGGRARSTGSLDSAPAVIDLRRDMERQLGHLRVEAADSMRSLVARVEHMEASMKQELQRPESHAYTV